MERVLVLDIHGTLTDRDGRFDDAFMDLLQHVVMQESCYLVSGADYNKLLSDVPAWLLNRVNGVFACSGAEFFEAGEPVYSMEHAFPDELLAYCEQLVDGSSYPQRVGRHIELRPGTLNVSVVGRNANLRQRKDYFEHDCRTKERRRLKIAIEMAFPDYEANFGGQISVDVSPRGWNKARVYRELRRRHPSEQFHFFGDNIKNGGNDMPLARALEMAGVGHVVHSVNGYQQTRLVLENLTMPQVRRIA